MRWAKPSASVLTLLGLLLASNNGWADNPNPAHEWNLQALFSPDAEQLYREQGGMVFIYSGMTDEDINHALDCNFDRIQAMMFVATIHVGERGLSIESADTGAATAETYHADDGC